MCHFAIACLRYKLMSIPRFECFDLSSPDGVTVKRLEKKVRLEMPLRFFPFLGHD